MAPLAKNVSILFLVLLLSSVHAEARVSKHVPIMEAPVQAPSISPAPAPIESTDYPYGLYGGVSTVSPTKKTMTATTATTLGNEEDEILVEEIDSERLAKNNARNQYSNGYPNNYNNNGYSNNYNNNGYSNNYNNNGYLNSVYNNNNGYSNSYRNEKQGMSDTGFLDNGKYYYGVNNENLNQNGYESVKENSNAEGYYGNGEKSKYEFDSMEEYEKQQGYNPGTEKYYNP
ncbi:uncharacterized protein [Coffea arabica]|uniref:Uncharacterized protein n=1 Tax=Coffea arabica TaxID=13443 RepID=A0A6P6XII9_COFAR|nr:putative mediator of RNA polymerase II transcription subunit 26 [Coffea arabica]